jgi:hypothetical protein
MVMWPEDSWPAHDEDVDDLVRPLSISRSIMSTPPPPVHTRTCIAFLQVIWWCIVAEPRPAARSGRTEKEAFIPMDTRTATLTFMMSL